MNVFLGSKEYQENNWEGAVEKVYAKLFNWTWVMPQLSYRGRVLVTGQQPGRLHAVAHAYGSGTTPLSGGGDTEEIIALFLVRRPLDLGSCPLATSAVGETGPH